VSQTPMAERHRSAKASTVIVAASLFGLFRILSNPLSLREGFQGSEMEQPSWLDSVRLNMDVVGPGIS
jgi:hypothetical protein